jgi:ATP-dependent RNA helicase HelY
MPIPEAARLDSRAAHETAWRGRGAPRSRHFRLHTPRRSEVVERLAEEEMLPAIYFIFSRIACDDAVRQCLDAGLRLTTPEEAAAVRVMAEAKTEILSDADLTALDYGRWLAGLEAGFAAHHAGMVPLFKEAVEACFSAGLAKVVFATETLALGINMPARTVVIEKLSKFTGERHEFLTPGEYTQLTGRAGRRGIDELGNAVVLWSPFVPFDQVAGLASTRTYALSSSFHPTYNMAANLVRRYAPDAAHHLLNLSFAQYRADRDVVRLEAQLDKLERALDAARRDAACERGDIEEYRRTLVSTGPSERAAVNNAVGRLRPGDVLVLTGGKSAGRVAVISTSHRRGGEVRLGVLTPDRRYLTLSARDFADPPLPTGHLDLPLPHAPRNPSFQRAVAKTLAGMRGRDAGGKSPRRTKRPRAETHPVSECPGLRRHLSSAERRERLEKDVRRLERRIQGRSESLARQFDRVLRVLETWGYVDGWSLTSNGEQLVRIYHECDLVVAEALRLGFFDDLDPASVAALASAFTYQARGPATRGRDGGEQSQPWFPSAQVKRSWHEIERIVAELNRAEADAGLPMTRGPDPGFFAAAYGWAAGEDLAQVIAEEEFSGGDFVRNIKQLIDLVRQIGEVSTSIATAKAAAEAGDRLFRGVVIASSVVGG